SPSPASSPSPAASAASVAVARSTPFADSPAAPFTCSSVGPSGAFTCSVSSVDDVVTGSVSGAPAPAVAAGDWSGLDVMQVNLPTFGNDLATREAPRAGGPRLRTISPADFPILRGTRAGPPPWRRVRLPTS